MAKIRTPEINKTVYSSLRTLGASKLEANLYIAALRMGPSTVGELAEVLSIAPPNVYKLIDKLEKRGLGHFADSGYGRKLTIEPPGLIIEKLQKKAQRVDRHENSLTGLMPDLLALYQQGDLPTSVRIYDGAPGFLKIFDMSLEQSKEEFQFFGSAHDFIGFISWAAENKYIANRLKKKIKARVLLLQSEDTETLKKNDEKELRETRIFKTDSRFSTSFQLFGNKVVLWQPKAPLAVVIQDEYFVVMFKTIFETLWEQSQ